MFLTADGQRLRDLMYEPITGATACYRRLNGTHQVGCSSHLGGDVGILHVVRNSSDVDWLLGDASSAGVYTAVLPLAMFEPTTVGRLVARPDKINGIVVFNNGSNVPEVYSPESRCPNEWSQSPSVRQCSSRQSAAPAWNPQGAGLLQMNFPFPVFYLPPDKNDEIQLIVQCFEKYNNFDLENQSSRSLCAVELDAFMFAAVSSEVCIRRSNLNKNLSPVRYCDPLAGKSVYTSLFSRNPYVERATDINPADFGKNATTIRHPVKESDGSMILVTANMDSTSFFDGSGVGAIGTVSGLTTMLAAAEVLNRMLPANQSKIYERNVMFIWLNGESYDYIGSQRLAYDLSRSLFPEEGPPLQGKSLGAHLHAGQIRGRRSDNLMVFSRKYAEPEHNEKIASLVKAMSHADIVPSLSTAGWIPPSATHSLDRILNVSVPSGVVVDHGDSFSNHHYQSILDDKDYLEYVYYNRSFDAKKDGQAFAYPDSLIPDDSIQSRYANISTALAKALYQHVTGKSYTGDLKASRFLVDEVLHCYLESSSCPLLLAATSPSMQAPGSAPLPAPALYVGVSGSSWIPMSLHMTQQIAAMFVATDVNRTKDECHATDDNEMIFYQWISGWHGEGACIRSSINHTLAVSPAFSEPDYDFASGKYSTWTESVWRSMSARILLRPARAAEARTLIAGVITLILSAFLLYVGKKHVSTVLDGVQETGPEQQQIQDPAC